MQTLHPAALAARAILAAVDPAAHAALVALDDVSFGDCLSCGSAYVSHDGEPENRYCLDCALDVAYVATLPARLAEPAAAVAEAAGGSAEDRRAAVLGFVSEQINTMPVIGGPDRAAVKAEVLRLLGLGER